jgi:hypothetical protein
VGGLLGAVSGYTGSGGTPQATSVTRATPTLPVPSGGGGIFSGMNQQADTWLQKQGIAPPQTGGCPPGFHLNKHPLAATQKHGAVPARSMCVRNRHLNPLNPKALRHSLRREKRARKLIGKLHVYAPVRHAVSGRGGHRAGCGCAVCKRR